MKTCGKCGEKMGTLAISCRSCKQLVVPRSVIVPLEFLFLIFCVALPVQFFRSAVEARQVSRERVQLVSSVKSITSSMSAYLDRNHGQFPPMRTSDQICDECKIDSPAVRSVASKGEWNLSLSGKEVQVTENPFSTWVFASASHYGQRAIAFRHGITHLASDEEFAEMKAGKTLVPGH